MYVYTMNLHGTHRLYPNILSEISGSAGTVNLTLSEDLAPERATLPRHHPFWYPSSTWQKTDRNLFFTSKICHIFSKLLTYVHYVYEIL